MELFNRIKKANTLRIVFFGIATIAVVALTLLNVYSLYQLRNASIESATDVKKLQLEDFNSQVRYRFFNSVWDLRKVDMNVVESYWYNSDVLPDNFVDVLNKASQDPLYDDIHFIYGDQDGCTDDSAPVFKYDPQSRYFVSASDIPQIVCDGFGISKSRARVIVDDYRFNTKSTFDSHRSLTIALIDLEDNSVFGHLNLSINRDYLVNDYIAKELKKNFGNADESGIVVWLRDWIQDDILLSSDDGFVYDRDEYPIDLRQRFSDSLDDWTLHATILASPTIAASDASLNRNLIVMGVAVFVLLGALFFIFINAQRERELAQRQAGFLANITHELKTPLAVMQAAGENIADGRVTDGKRLKSYGDHIYNESVRLKKMIEKLLDAAKVDSGQVSAEQAPHFLHELTAEFYEANKEYIESKGFDFFFHHDKNLPLVMVDSDHIETILNNLVENAMKYSREIKKINLSVTKKGNFVALEVADKGTGIPKSSIRYIFDKFYRVEDTLTAKTKGHGLGLSIVKNMVEINGGTIDVKSQYGKGSVFTVKFPTLMKSDYSDDDIITNQTKTDRLKTEKADTYVQ
ncbi:sensor histidine kinase [Rhodohalobacter sp. SW132]|uniref:sensor histidine kinase n=1 Tax=Rhodohalobacter sp. SW132 TaxID=2293433 RepID=UPI000E22FA75|nr:HAMP domain-containing sensor histidine kinase [Rhodohalobacter sp. SW132]REL33211.1 sensor histidine kinase [Rhodohalobacter sp. SW132]